MSTYRYHSRLIAVVHSWQPGPPIDLSADIIACSVSKQTKRVGSWSLTVAPRINWFNAVFPNDTVNIYYDPGDGVSGWTRVMFGFVDRVARAEAVVDENGRVSTAFVISGSDFMKAVDRTEILFRPELALRSDWKLDERFFFNNIGGMGMMFRGASGRGSPDIIVEGLLASMMGYGAQWQLPPSYPPRSNVLAARNKRVQKARKRITSDIYKALQVLGFEKLVGATAGSQSSLNDKLRALYAIVFSKNPDKTKAKAIATVKDSTLAITSYVNVVGDLSSDSNGSVYDIMDPSFTEGLCIDGYADAAAIWQSEGALSNLVYKWSNEHVNEVIFDLRPVASNDGHGDSLSGRAGFADSGSGTTSTYSRGADDLGINVRGNGAQGAEVAGVKYVPTMIMREHPYSTVPGLDLFNYKVLNTFPVGPLNFGPIFSQQPTNTDPVTRVLYDYSAHGLARGISSAPEMYMDDAKPIKHLDVARVNLDEMTRMDVSRGDADVYNMFVMYQTLYPTATRYNLPDYLPIFNLASIARDGVRMREITTNYAGWTKQSGNGKLNKNIPFNLIRWATMIEHWYQHNAEFLTGQITMRPRADIRVGYRLDIPERAESYYVESVSHTWEKGSNGEVKGATTLQVARGQRTDPFPIYIPPSLGKKADVTPQALDSELDIAATAREVLAANQVAGAFSGNRTKTGRLARFFPVRSTQASTRAHGGFETDLAGGTGPNTVDKTPAKGTGVYFTANPSADTLPPPEKA